MSEVLKQIQVRYVNNNNKTEPLVEVGSSTSGTLGMLALISDAILKLTIPMLEQRIKTLNINITRIKPVLLLLLLTPA